MGHLARFASLSALVLGVACGGGDGSGPSDPVPTSLSVQAGNNQSATVGTAVGTAPAVLVKDQDGAGVANITVTFAAQAGNGSVSGASATTDANGIAMAGGWTLPTTTGTYELTASVADLPVVTFTATATAGGRAALVFVTPPSTTAPSGGPFGTQPVLRLKDAFGNDAPEAGVTVTAGLAVGGGALVGNATAVSDAGGVVTFTGIGVRGNAGPRTLSFTVAGLPPLLSGNIQVTAAAATTMAASAGSGQTAAAGTAVAVAPAVLVSDALGNPVSGVNVTFAVASGGGSLTGGNATTNASGIATVGSWTLGTVAGSNSLTATSAGLTGSPVGFTATGVAGPASTLAIVTQPSGTAVNGVVLAQQPVVRLVDAFGNAVATSGVTITASWTRPGTGALGSATAGTNAAGVATFSGVAITGLVGTYTMHFSAAGLAAVSSQPIVLTAGAATTIAMSAGDGQVAAVGTAVPVAPAVLVTDVSGNGVSGVGVTFAVTSGGGSVTGAGATTNPTGVARVGSWTLGATPGSNTLTATSAGLTGSPVTFTATGTAVSNSQFTIELVFLSGGTPAQQVAFAAAKARWEAVITGDLADFTITAPFNTTDCGAVTSSLINGTVDDIRIYADLVPIDGPGHILGSAGPCDLRPTGSQLPYVGVMRFDIADLADLEADGSLSDVVLHEMGHVLGFGVLWEPIPGFWSKTFLTGGCPANTPVFTGAGAVAAYTTLNGGGTATGVPVENTGTCSGPGNSEGDGTRDSHWEESIFRSEVLTGFISGTIRPLSAASVGSMEDLGYTVDLNHADPFSILTQPTVVAPGGRAPVKLVGDVIRLPRWTVDPRTGRRRSSYSRE